MELSLDNYYISDLTYFSGNLQSTEVYSKLEEDQDLAISMILDVLEDIEKTRKEQGEANPDMIGPPRLEVELYQRSRPEFKRTVVAVGFAAPYKTFKASTVRGWELTAAGKKKDPTEPVSLHSSTYAISKLVLVRANGRSTTTYVGSDDTGWNRVRKYCEEQTTAQLREIANWRPGTSSQLDDDDDGDWDSSGFYSHCGGYHSRSSYAPKPAIGSFRVSGDEVGAQLFLDQMQRIVGAKKPEDTRLEETSASAEKKVEAEEAASPSTDRAPSSAVGSGKPLPSTGSTWCPYCSTLDCSTHSGNPDAFALGGEGWTGLDFRTIH